MKAIQNSSCPHVHPWDWQLTTTVMSQSWMTCVRLNQQPPSQWSNECSGKNVTHLSLVSFTIYSDNWSHKEGAYTHPIVIPFHQFYDVNFFIRGIRCKSLDNGESKSCILLRKLDRYLGGLDTVVNHKCRINGVTGRIEWGSIQGEECQGS